MGIHKEGMTPPDLEEGHVRVYVDVNVSSIKKECQEELEGRVNAIPADKRNRPLHVEEAEAEVRLRYMDRLMAAAVVQMQEERERAHRRLTGEDIDKKIVAKRAEIEKLEAERTAGTEGSDEVAEDISAN